MSAFPRTIPVRLDEGGRIDVDVSCPRCGYNLRMQKLGADCPECGTPVDVSDAIPADHLDRADPAWRRRVANGAGWLAWGVVLILPCVVAGMAIALALTGWSTGAVLGRGFFYALLGSSVSLIVAVIGIWMLTAREPGRPETWMARGTRLSARWSSVGAGVGSVVLVGLAWQSGEVSGGSLSRLIAQDWKLFDIVASAVAACLAVAMLEAWRHLFKLAARADGPDVAQACRRAWKRYLIGVGILVALSAAVTVGDRLDLKWVVRFYEWFAGGSFLLVTGVLFWLWWTTLGLTCKLRRLLAPRPAKPSSDILPKNA